MNIEDKEIIITDEDGTQTKFNILFTFVNEDTHLNYVLFYDPNDEENISAMRYKDDGTLEDIESDEEWDMVEEVLNTFQDDPEAEEFFKE
ncbi:MAG: DUF1292 domain-containing protein [Bacilli bacterium]|nr:DUF1292 domain-containing protein [Bacilli bacterium]